MTLDSIHEYLLACGEETKLLEVVALLTRVRADLAKLELVDGKEHSAGLVDSISGLMHSAGELAEACDEWENRHG